MTDFPPIMSARQVATIVRCGRSTIAAEIEAGRLIASRIGNGRQFRIRREHVIAWLDAQRVEPTRNDREWLARQQARRRGT